MVNPVGSGTSANGTSDTDSASQASLRQKDFLRLMVAQVKNQDPLSPSANGEFLSQLAQFSTNDGINNMQASIEKLATSLQSNQALQASALVGRQVMIDGDKMSLGSEGGTKASFNMVAGLSNLKASIYSESGELIKTISIGQPALGNQDVSWDGTNEKNERVAAGKYKIEVSGLYNGKEATVNTTISANVDSVTLGQNGEGLKLNVAGVGSITLDKVKQISV